MKLVDQEGKQQQQNYGQNQEHLEFSLILPVLQTHQYDSDVLVLIIIGKGVVSLFVPIRILVSIPIPVPLKIGTHQY